MDTTLDDHFRQGGGGPSFHGLRLPDTHLSEGKGQRNPLYKTDPVTPRFSVEVINILSMRHRNTREAFPSSKSHPKESMTVIKE